MSVIAGCWHAPDSWVVTGWVGQVGVFWTFDAPIEKPVFNSPKISWLFFLYRDFEEQIEDPRMLDVTSETVVKHVIIHVIILKSRLTLPARTRFGTFSLIDDSRCARALSTTAPVRNITLPYSKDAVGVFRSPSQPGHTTKSDKNIRKNVRYCI